MLFTVLLCCSCAPVSSEAPFPGEDEENATPLYVVALDFGHGGFDGGAVGTDTGVIESELNLAVGMLVKEELESANIRVVLTRSDSEALAKTKREDMRVRGEILKAPEFDCVVSIHMNKFTNRSVRGPMTYYQAGAEAGQGLVQSIIDALTCALDKPARLANPGDNFVTRVPISPAALVECGFLSNAEDERLLCTKEYQELLAHAIACGILDWLERA